jgi:hypothetical protein
MTIGNDGNLSVMENNEGYNGRMLKVDLKTKAITLLADGLGVNPNLNKRNWHVLFPISQVAQTSDGRSTSPSLAPRASACFVRSSKQELTTIVGSAA